MASAAEQSGLSPGSVIGGKYVVERVLGAGGMGVVLAARHKTLRQLVAIKVLLPDAPVATTAVARFIREGRAAAALRSEHVVRVLDVDQLEDGMPYMVMEYLDGRDLAAELRSRGALPVATAASYVIQACAALAEAHSQGIVHRDLKPANLLLTRRSDGTELVKLVDFGISKLSDGLEGEASLTRTHALMGSPLYMSPEQVMNAKLVDARTDIWSLGVILWELLTARTPFEAETLPALSVKIATEAPAAPSSLRPELPRALDACVMRCIEKDPSLRYQTVGELRDALLAFAHAEVSASQATSAEQSAAARSLAAPDAAFDLPATAPGWGSTRIPPGPPRRRVRALWITVLSTALIAVTGLALVSSMPRAGAREPARAGVARAAMAGAHRSIAPAPPEWTPSPPPSGGELARPRSPASETPKREPVRRSKPSAPPAEICKSGLVWNGKRCERPIADDI